MGAMPRRITTVCVLCLLCVSHECWAHHADASAGPEYARVPRADASARHRKPYCPSCRRLRRDAPATDRERADHVETTMAYRRPPTDDAEPHAQLRRIFAEFGDPERMTINFEEFASLVQSGRLSTLKPFRSKPSSVGGARNESRGGENGNGTSQASGAENVQETDSDSWQCLHPGEFLVRYGVENGVVRPPTLLQMCPALLARSVATMEQERDGCVMVPRALQSLSEAEERADEGTSARVWLCATGSVIVVSLCGLLGVGIIPFMQRVFYQQLLQFLVALAVGTLSGDALLHLLPHAILGPESPHTHGDAHSQHSAAVWRGFVACLGLVFFFVTEKCLVLMAEWRKKRQRQRPAGGHSHKVKVVRDMGAATRKNSGEKADARADAGVVSAPAGKQCKHKYSSYPYCYGEIKDAADAPAAAAAATAEEGDSPPPAAAPADVDPPEPVPGGEPEDPREGVEAPSVAAAKHHPSACDSYTVIIREHESTHHGHSHAHGHVHAAPQSMSSVAWMVVMGDGLHNLTDGVAIGAAFAAGLPGGFSTALAVLCHELPHELGDFAVLLKAGMSLKQAVFYNVLSSLLCLAGMLFGVAVGHSPEATPWVFGAAAGVFLYIALVDMIPELSSNHPREGGSVCQCVLQVAGMLCGTGVMLLIALYEHDLKSVFGDAHAASDRH